MTTRRRAWSVLLVFVAASGGGCAGDGDASTQGQSQYAQALFNEVNDARLAAGLGALEWDECLAGKATARADVAADGATLDHAPLEVTCIQGDLAGENLSRSKADPSHVVAMWMQSPSHAANVLTASFDVAGVGCVPAPEALACSWVAEGTARDADQLS